MTKREEIKVQGRDEAFFWKAEPGEAISGVLASEFLFGEERYTLRDEKTGEIFILPEHTNLRQKLAQCKVGDRLEIVFRRDIPIKGSRTFKIYSVYRLV